MKTYVSTLAVCRRNGDSIPTDNFPNYKATGVVKNFLLHGVRPCINMRHASAFNLNVTFLLHISGKNKLRLFYFPI